MYNRNQLAIPGAVVTLAIAAAIHFVTNKKVGEKSDASVEKSVIVQPPEKRSPIHEAIQYPRVEQNATFLKKLKQFDEFQSHVLLKEKAAIEKRKLLSDAEMLRVIKTNLSKLPQDWTTLENRLQMIDFLDEALAWKENPLRNEIVEGLIEILKTNVPLYTSQVAKKIFAGDKMELFAILTEQTPQHAKDILETVKDDRLSEVFRYAQKRLAIRNSNGAHK